MTPRDETTLSAAHKVAVADALNFIAGCRAMLVDYRAGDIEERQVVEGLIKWSNESQTKKLEQSLDQMINPEPVSIDPAMYRASLKRRAGNIRAATAGNASNTTPKKAGTTPGRRAQAKTVLPPEPTTPTNASNPAPQQGTNPSSSA
ncbi:hypothetical protein DL546_008027 [Coniochaeta pulveracea]|uniref:Uncharacterized protein n=1 Tax=Coniochaeta pulveracea TaxID=177199 RepID=A0A420YKY8_9PEZI|nr:hypothetical protein DL546_008027 [Coniochaeta pulveracea]